MKLKSSERRRAGGLGGLGGLGGIVRQRRRLIQIAFLALFAILFFITCWPYTATPVSPPADTPSHYADDLRAREWIEAETFLALDPLVSVATSLAAKTWVWSLAWAVGILLVHLLVPRGFCSYVCPLGTLIDGFDASIGRRLKRWRHPAGNGAWGRLRFVLLVATLTASVAGVLLAGFVAAIPIVTRGLMFTLAPLQLGLARGWHQVPPFNAGHAISVGLFAAVFFLGLLGPRFWCRVVCPTGALFSLGSWFRLTERRVTDACTACGRCAARCPFDAIDDDAATRPLACASCRTCATDCPPGAIAFVTRWSDTGRTPTATVTSRETPLSRRGFVTGVASGLGLALGVRHVPGLNATSRAEGSGPVRPPMSVPERAFLQLCIRCGECFKACPNSVLQPLGFELGLDSIWTPFVAADWSGCEPSCNNCGQVCPTGAIRALPLAEKRAARMGLAVIDRTTCLPWAGTAACQLCVDECNAAGYAAIEVERIGVQMDADGQPIEESGVVAPKVVADRCVGCGLCQSVCFRLNAKHQGLLAASAITVTTAGGHEDRMRTGSYIARRNREREAREATRRERDRAMREQLDAEFGWDE